MDWKSIVGTVAPTIATALGGPLAGMAVKALASGLGLADGAGEDEVARVLENADPATLARIKEIDAQFRKDMKALDVDLARIAADDRNSAREREARVGGYANPVLATVVVAGFFAVVAAVISGHAGADPATATLVGTVVGYASAKADQVVSYYFGSSAGSKRKTEAMASQIGGRK